ncbi:PREDICTED: mitoguardin isoform X1 [Trachymyrmex septentrionalis]|uniref:mitoguardin isoform X1 n=1 Tax=Trachymyrmex septentrionalis TaxID=34720 RepID=UPI00084ED6E8|nr:PREDICTED: mitoguardin isoform X1 [Trachymyrmex septentrionalis]
MTMSLFNVRQFFGTLYQRYMFSLPAIHLSRTQKIFIICFTSGSILLGGLAQFLKRRRRHSIPPSRRHYRDYKTRLGNIKNANFDVLSQASWARRSEASTRSHISDRASLISSVPGGPDNNEKLTPQQYGVLEKNVIACARNDGKGIYSSDWLETGLEFLRQKRYKLMPFSLTGLEALEKALYCWEDALTAFSSTLGNDTLALPSKADAAFTHDVQELLDMGYQIQSHAELLFLDQHSVLFRNDSEESLDKPSNFGTRLFGFRDKADAASSPESFESARDGVADLREFEEFSELFPHFEKQKLYHAALKQYEDKGIPCRRLHTELVKCGSDVEYLAKVYCLRQAYTKLFNLPTATTYIVDVGRQVISDLIMYADRDPKDYLMYYERMMEFLQEPHNHSIMEEELTARGVKCMNFYDVLIDFILLDAFEDMEKPPSSVKAIIQNRWVSASFRETAIGTTLWSVLAGKRKMLKYDQGFLAHFYSISEQISPMFIWGFLGSEESLRSTCQYFKEQVIEFLVDIFNFFKVRYTTVDDLAVDILREMKLRVDNINQRLSLEGC